MSDTEPSALAITPQCPLLKFPPEIRNRIWTLVVKVDRVVAMYYSGREMSDKPLSPTTIALAFTCRQIYREVTPIYYSENLFHFPHEAISTLREFAAAIGPANAESITAVEISIYSHIMQLSQQQLEELWPFPNLKTLVYFEHPRISGHYPNKLRLPKPSRTVAVLWKSRTYLQMIKLYS